MTQASPITIIIPTYRRKELLKRALNSALNQTYPHFQVCIYDNASNDGTKEAVADFIKKDPRVKYHCHPENIGMMANYEYALSQVDTPYFSLLSDDDLLFPWFLEETLKGFEKCPEAAFSAGSTIIMTPRGKVIRVPLDLWEKGGCFLKGEGVLQMISKYPVPTCILFHQKVLHENLMDRENVLMWDCDFLIQIAGRYSIFISKRPCGIFLSHKASYSNTRGFEDWALFHSRLIERLECIPNFSDRYKKDATLKINNKIKAMHCELVLVSLSSWDNKRALEYVSGFQRNYEVSFFALLLQILVRICLIFPPFIYLFRLTRFILKIGKRGIHRSYQRYAHWLSYE